MQGNLHTIIELETVGSTNLYAEELLVSQNVSNGTVIFAIEQTSGKGQGDNSWESEPGQNLTFSLVLFPGFLPPERQFQLNKAITLGILDYLNRFPLGQEVVIKWPNDLNVGNRKIGGILINNTISGNLFVSCVAGIGININQKVFGPDIPNPVSLKQLTGYTIQLKEALQAVLECIDVHYSQLLAGNFSLLDREYRRNLLGYDLWADYIVNNMVKKGRILDVDESGKLLLETANGPILSLLHGEIGFILA
jgi:BirA family transcriptional regulator, biotin operon repressor / biotin---[acetyl-CoA-carboxylase] ligase